MILDLYTVALLVIVGRGFYLAHLSSCCDNLATRLTMVGPSLVGAVLLASIFWGVYPVSMMEVIVLWFVAMVYCTTPIEVFRGGGGDSSGTT
jgi:hypothetical protein